MVLENVAVSRGCSRAASCESCVKRWSVPLRLGSSTFMVCIWFSDRPMNNIEAAVDAVTNDGSKLLRHTYSYTMSDR